jgi:hypothetical protein
LPSTSPIERRTQGLDDSGRVLGRVRRGTFDVVVDRSVAGRSK